MAMTSAVPKHTDVVSKLWSVKAENYLKQRVNLQPRQQRKSFRCLQGIYDYSKAPAGALIVDFAARHVGGGCFGGGFV